MQVFPIQYHRYYYSNNLHYYLPSLFILPSFTTFAFLQRNPSKRQNRYEKRWRLCSWYTTTQINSHLY